jgi:hypothetical protein
MRGEHFQEEHMIKAIRFIHSKLTDNFMIAGLILATSISFGLAYGSKNQNTYLIDGLVKLNPNFLTGDWLAHETLHYHHHFSNIIWLLGHINIPLEVGLPVIAVFLRIISLVVIYKISSLLTYKHRVVLFLLVLFFIVLEGTESVAETYIFGSELQPSSFASTFTIVAFLYFLRGNYFASGVFIGLAGYMHTNFLLLGFVYLSVSHLLIGEKQFFKRVLLQFAPSIIIFAFQLPFLLSMMMSKNANLSTFIFQHIRSPYHYIPDSFLMDFSLFAGWSFIGVAGLISINLEDKLKLRIFGLYSSLLIVVIAATFLTTVTFIPFVSKLFFWRLAPFSVLLSQIIFISAALRIGFSEEIIQARKLTVSLILALVGSLFISFWYFYDQGLSFKYLMLIIVFIFITIILLRRYFHEKSFKKAVNESASKAFFLTILLIALFTNRSVFYRRSTLINGFPGKAETELYKWCKTTPGSSIFLTPPKLQNFRLHGERAIVVDWKSTPIDPDGLVEWYKRIEDVSGIKDVRTKKDADAGYLALDVERLRYLRSKYNINFAVLYKKNDVSVLNFPHVFENKRFTVIKLDKL